MVKMIPGSIKRIKSNAQSDGARSGQPVQPDPKNILSKKTEDKNGDRNAKIGKRGQRIIGERILAQRRDYSDNDRNEQSKEQSRAKELQCSWKAPGKNRRHRLIGGKRETIIANQ